MKTTKRALFSSVMALVLCFAMLLGTTYAWFTDTVTSGSNVIQAGTLDIDVQYTLDGENWADLDGADDLFQKGLWEPGHTEVVALKVTNKGNLSLKYSAKMNIISEAVGKNKDGGNIVLSEILTVGTLVQAVNQFGDVAVALAFENENMYKGTTAFKDANILRANQELHPGDAHYVIIKVDMAESVGNEANHNGKDIPTIEFGINVIATQYNAEGDSFGNTYDVNATYLYKDADGAWLINNIDELFYFASEVNGGNDYKGQTVKLTADIDLDGYKWAPIGNSNTNFKGIFDGNGKTISNMNVNVKKNAGLFGVTHGGEIKNVTVKGATVKAEDYAGAIVGSALGKVTNCHAVDCEITVTPFLKADGVTYDGGAKAGGVIGRTWENSVFEIAKCTATNVKVVGYRDIGGLIGMTYNQTVIDCNVTDSEVSYLYLAPDQKYDGNTPNENIAEIVGRPRTTTVITNSQFTNVSTNSIYAYGVKLTPVNSAENHGIITVSDKEGLLNLSTLFEDWVALFSDGNGKTYTNFANGAGADYYYSTWIISLAADIDLNNDTINPITIKHPISTGAPTFNGNNHTIKNAKIVTDANTTNEAGLFIANSCSLKNLVVENVHVTGSLVGSSTAGVVAGSCNAGIDNITVRNSSVTGGKYTGGVVGYGYTYVTNCTLENVTVKGGYKLGGVIGYICASDAAGKDVTGNTLTDCTVDGIGGGQYADGKTTYVVGKIVGNYNCNGTCNNNTVTNMTTTATANIGKIEAGNTVTE